MSLESDDNPTNIILTKPLIKGTQFKSGQDKTPSYKSYSCSITDPQRYNKIGSKVRLKFSMSFPADSNFYMNLRSESVKCPELINRGAVMKKFSELSNGDRPEDEGHKAPLYDDSQNVMLFEAEFDQLIDELVRRGTHVVVGYQRKMKDEFGDFGYPSEVKMSIKGDPMIAQGLAKTLHNLAEERTMSFVPPVVDYGFYEGDDDYDSDSDDYSEDN